MRNNQKATKKKTKRIDENIQKITTKWQTNIQPY